MKYINTDKLEHIKFEKENFYIVADFDKTITSFESCDSWDASGKRLGDEFQKEINRLYEMYRPIEVSYKLPIEEKKQAIKTWYEECMELYYQYHLTKEKLSNSIKESDLQFREGAKELLVQANQNDIPVIILSAGIGNVIEQFLRESKCYFENMYIISNFIEFDAEGNMKKFDNNKIIHTLNKTMEHHLPVQWKEKLQKKKYALLFGDLIEDLNMISIKQKEDAITVGFLEKNVEENLDRYRQNFDVVLTRKRCNNEDDILEKKETRNVRGSLMLIIMITITHISIKSGSRNGNKLN